MAGVLCKVCQGISPRSIARQRPYIYPDGRAETQFGYKHLLYEELDISANGCRMCAMLLHELKASRSNKKDREHRLIFMPTEFNRNRNMEAVRLAGLNIAVTKSDAQSALSGEVARRSIQADPASAESFEKIQSWLTECSQSHHECRVLLSEGSDGLHKSRLDEKFPSRLLDVGSATTDMDKSICRLIDRTDIIQQPLQAQSWTGKYVALSYCWGIGQQLTTLKANLIRHKEGIDLVNMSLTLREAVIATRKLGVRFLWIDALCIVQDDAADWKREAPQMGRIYNNAFCTVAAVGADSSAGGLFLPRVPLEDENVVSILYDPEVSEVGWTASSSSTPSRKREMHVTPVRFNMFNAIQNSVWNTRGWVLQERNLSRRIVLFAGGQTFFECQRHSLGEDNLPIHYQSKRAGSAAIPQGDAWSWCLLVQDFTSRNLTMAGDKLYAIEGLGRELLSRSSGAYVAGIFTEWAALHLLWYCKSGALVAPTLTSGLARAPSWSWAWLDGPVCWEAILLNEVNVECELEFVDVDGAGSQSFDNDLVRKAALQYSGPVVSIGRSKLTIAEEGGGPPLMGRDAYLIDIETHQYCFKILDDRGKELGWMVLDEGECLTGPFLAVVVSTSKGEEAKQKPASILVLKASIELDASTFLRVGMGELQDLRKVRQLEKRSLTIL